MIVTISCVRATRSFTSSVPGMGPDGLAVVLLAGGGGGGGGGGVCGGGGGGGGNGGCQSETRSVGSNGAASITARTSPVFGGGNGLIATNGAGVPGKIEICFFQNATR